MFKNKFLKWAGISAIVLIVGYLTEDIIMTNILGYYHCSQDPNPKTLIKKTVEYPESIYWEDNVYPGFNEADRRLMIINYLDGKHLKAMALNGDDGKVYVYTAKAGDFDSFEFDKEKYKDRYQQYADLIMQKQQAYSEDVFKTSNMKLLTQIVELAEMNKIYLKQITSTPDKTLKKQLIQKNRAVLAKKKELLNTYVQKVMDSGLVFDTNTDMPLMNYTVRFQPVNLGKLSSQYLYSDKVTITDNHTQEVIAYNQRIMHFFYKLFPDISQGNIYFYPHPICGEERSWYERNVFVFNRIRSVPNHTLSINKKAYLEHYQGRR